MKKCPQCGQPFDDSQSFCLTDGTLLIAESESFSGQEKTIFLLKRKAYLLWFVPLILVVLAFVAAIFFVFPSGQKDGNPNSRRMVAATYLQTMSVATPALAAISIPVATPIHSPMATHESTPAKDVNENQNHASTPTPEKTRSLLMKIEDHQIVSVCNNAANPAVRLSVNFH